MIASALERLMDLIGYPRDERTGDDRSASLAIDDYRILAEVRDGALRLSWAFTADEADSAKLAGYAAGRLLAEAATLAYDPEKKTLLLWQTVDVGATDRALKESFQAFLDSCDWWAARLKELENKDAVRVPEMVIRP